MAHFDTVQATSAAQFDRQSDRYGKSHILADTSDVASALWLSRAGWNVTAGDISPRMLENPVKLLADERLRLETKLFPAEAIPFPDNSFELVTVRVASHHFSSPPHFIAEVARILKPGGHFLLIDGTVPDNDSETEEWLHRVEKWRDPSHRRFHSRFVWEALVMKNGMQLLSSSLHEKKQPDLEWYFETAATPFENRAFVLEAVRTIPLATRQALRLDEEEGKIIWWWPILTLLARKTEVGKES